MGNLESDLTARFVDAIRRKDFDAMFGVLHEDHVYRGTMEIEDVGPSFYRALRTFYDVFPDLETEVIHVFGGEGYGAARLRFCGTHLGEGWPTPPTGRPIEFISHLHCRIEGGKIVETWEKWDRAGVRDQMGWTAGMPVATPT